MISIANMGRDFSRHSKIFADKNNLKLTDLNNLYDVFTYSNVDPNSFTWIDHLVCSDAIDSLVNTCEVSYEFVSSDHKPLIIGFKDLLQLSITSINHQPILIPKAVPD